MEDSVSSVGNVVLQIRHPICLPENEFSVLHYGNAYAGSFFTVPGREDLVYLFLVINSLRNRVT